MAVGLQANYPVGLSVEYPSEGLDRLATAFRLILVIPILILFGSIANATIDFWTNDTSWRVWFGGGGFVFFPTLLMIVVRQKYPRWWFDFNVELLRFQNRVTAYLFLLRDEYPSTDEEQAVHVELGYPENLNRWLPLVKWLLVIPHYFALFFLSIGVFFTVIYAWFAILFTGSYPRGAFDFVVDVMRWGNRVTAYAFLLTTDEYPPFRLGQ